MRIPPDRSDQSLAAASACYTGLLSRVVRLWVTYPPRAQEQHSPSLLDDAMHISGDKDDTSNDVFGKKKY